MSIILPGVQVTVPGKHQLVKTVAKIATDFVLQALTKFSAMVVLDLVVNAVVADLVVGGVDQNPRVKHHVADVPWAGRHRAKNSVSDLTPHVYDKKIVSAPRKFTGFEFLDLVTRGIGLDNICAFNVFCFQMDIFYIIGFITNDIVLF